MTLRSLLAEVLSEIENLQKRDPACKCDGNDLESGLDINGDYETNLISPHQIPDKNSNSGKSNSEPTPHGSRLTSAVLDLRLRDLRRLDFSINPNEELTVQVRRHVVLFSVDPIRAIVTADRLRIFVPPGADSTMKLLEEYMSEWLDSESVSDNDNKIASAPLVSAFNNFHSSLNTGGYKSTLTHKFSGLSFDGPPVNDSERNFASIISCTGGNPSVPTLGTTFEVHAYESLLAIVKDLVKIDFDHIHGHTSKLLAFFKHGALVSPSVQEKLRFLKDKISRLLSKLRSYRKSLDDVIEDDETMALMNLTSLAADPQLYRYPLSPVILCQHEEIEEALEGYLTDYSAYKLHLDFMKTQIQSAEVQASLRLDISRNKVLVANIALSICSLFVAIGGYIAGLFGMNLDNTLTIQEYDGSFFFISLFSLLIILVGITCVYYYLIKTNVIPSESIDIDVV